MRCNYTLGVVIECAAILLITLISSTSAVNLDSPRNNLRLAALLSLKVGGVQRVQILFGGDILQDSLDPQKVTCLCRILWEEIITPEGDVEFQPPQDWVSRECSLSFSSYFVKYDCILIETDICCNLCHLCHL